MNIPELLREQMLAAALAERDRQVIDLYLENQQLKAVISGKEDKEPDGDLQQPLGPKGV